MRQWDLPLFHQVAHKVNVVESGCSHKHILFSTHGCITTIRKCANDMLFVEITNDAYTTASCCKF